MEGGTAKALGSDGDGDSHQPHAPGTSKWTKIEHRLFYHITENWRGRPPTSHEAVVELIGATCTQEGLQVNAVLDEQDYQTGRKACDDQMARLQLHSEPFHGEWNHTLLPRVPPAS